MEKFLVIIPPKEIIEDNKFKDIVAYLEVIKVQHIISSKKVIDIIKNQEEYFLSKLERFQKKLEEHENYNFEEINIHREKINYQVIEKNNLQRMIDELLKLISSNNYYIIFFIEKQYEITIRRICAQKNIRNTAFNLYMPLSKKMNFRSFINLFI